METFHFLSCRNIKMTIMTSYIWIRDDVINFLKISQEFYPLCIPTKFQHDVTWIRKKFRKICLFDHVCSQALPPLIGYHGNNFLFQKMTYIMVLKVTKFREDQLNRFWDI